MEPNTPQQNDPYRPADQQPTQPTQPSYQQPEQPASQPTPIQPEPLAPQTPASVPGKTLGIVAFVLSLLGGGLISLILGIVARSQSKKAGSKNGLALAAIIISIITMVAGIVIAGAIGILAGSAVSELQAQCKKLGPGTHTVNNVILTCDENSQPVSGSTSGSSTVTIPNDAATDSTE